MRQEPAAHILWLASRVCLRLRWDGAIHVLYTEEYERRTKIAKDNPRRSETPQGHTEDVAETPRRRVRLKGLGGFICPRWQSCCENCLPEAHSAVKPREACLGWRRACT